MTPDSAAETPARSAIQPEPQPGRRPSASVCEAYRETIEMGLSRGRNAKVESGRTWWTPAAFPAVIRSVKRFVRKFRGKHTPEACAVIETAPGEDAQVWVDYCTGPMVTTMLAAANTGAPGYSY